MSLKNKAADGFKWSFVDNLVSQSSQFVIGIILARLLSPVEFGLVGIVGVFTAISSVFIYGGLGEALIRKKDANEKDFSTIFVFNLLVSVFFYFLIVCFTSQIVQWFAEPLLTKIIRVFALSLIIDAIGIIPRVILTKNIDFKSQAKVSAVSSLLSGVIGIFLAYFGYGVWSLIVRTLIANILRSFLLWFYSKWKFSLFFSKDSFKELFGFSSRLLLSAILNQVYNNLYLLIIGKYFSPVQLGLYSRANQFQTLFSTQLDTVVQRVSYPVLAAIDDDSKLMSGYRRIIKSTMLLSLTLSMGMAVVSDNLIMVLLGPKWQESIIYLQLLCFVGVLYPLHSLNLNLLTVKGRSDLFLRLEVVKKILAIPVIILGVLYGIKVMILSMIVHSVISFFINSYWSGKIISYSSTDQILDLLPEILLATGMTTIVYLIGLQVYFDKLIELILQLIAGVISVILLSELFKLSSYLEIRSVILKRKDNLL